MIDINVACGQWPFRPTPATDAASLEELLREEGIERACAYPMEAYLWADPHEANQLRLPQLAASDFFIPSAVINPTLPRAIVDYRECVERWGIRMLRLIPSYHLYSLDEPGVRALMDVVAEDNVAVAVHIRAEDLRNRNPIYTPREVPFADIVVLAGQYPSVPIIAVGVGRPGEMEGAGVLPPGLLGAMIQGKHPDTPQGNMPENLYLELSFFESNESFRTALGVFRAERILFGSHAPVFYPRAAIMKVTGSGMGEREKTLALQGNAEQLLRLKG